VTVSVKIDGVVRGFGIEVSIGITVDISSVLKLDGTVNDLSVCLILHPVNNEDKVNSEILFKKSFLGFSIDLDLSIFPLLYSILRKNKIIDCS
jgi:hypothetical protein